MINILQVNKLYYPHIGGIEQVVRMLSENLSEYGYSVSVLSAEERGLGHSDRIFDVPVTKTTSLGIIKSVPIAPTFPWHLKKQIRDTDIVHFHLPNPLAVLSSLIIPSYDAATVVTYHSDIVRQSTALRGYKPFLHEFLSRADRIIATSPKLVESSEHLQQFNGKVNVIPLAVDLEEFEPTGSAIENDYGELIILFVGRLNYYKGVFHLIDAMEHVRAKLLIVGDGERRQYLEQHAQKVAPDKIEFVGKIPDEDLHRYYECADIFVLPSTEASEAFGIVQLEAMAHETPVVNTSLPTGVPWVSKNGETGRTVTPGDSNELANALNELIDDDELRHEFGRNAKQRVEANFTKEIFLQSTDELYKSLTR